MSWLKRKTKHATPSLNDLLPWGQHRQIIEWRSAVDAGAIRANYGNSRGLQEANLHGRAWIERHDLEQVLQDPTFSFVALTAAEALASAYSRNRQGLFDAIRIAALSVDEAQTIINSLDAVIYGTYDRFIVEACRSLGYRNVEHLTGSTDVRLSDMPDINNVTEH